TAAVVANRLRDRKDVRLHERSTQRRPAVSARAEADPLYRIADVRHALEVLALEPRDVNQQLRRRGKAGQGRNHCCPPPPSAREICTSDSSSRSSACARES